MRHKLLLFLLLNSFYLLGQNEVYYYKDSKKEFTSINIATAQFKRVDKKVVDKISDTYYWFKIPKKESTNLFTFEIRGVYNKNPKAFQNSKVLERLPGQRYNAYSFNRDYDVYIRVEPFLKAYFPFKLSNTDDYLINENKSILYNGFYYGFAALVILYSFVYYSSFKDLTYLHYAFFLTFISIGFIIIDGTLNYYNVSLNTIKYINVINYIGLAYFSAKFVNSFLFLEKDFPKIKKYAYAIGIVIIALVFIFLLLDQLWAYKLLGVMVFSLFLLFWILSLLLFSKNVYTKILVFAYITLLFSVFDGFVLSNFGYGILNNNNALMKVGGVIQIIVLWFAVIAREKELRQKNSRMKIEILEFSKRLDSSNQINKDDLLQTLSYREKEIFQLITLGLSYKDIASELHISVNTVKFHVKKIYDKLQVNSRKEVLKYDLK